MRHLLLALLVLLPLPALAHPGHLGDLDGHTHYLAAWALFGVIAGSAWLIWTERRAPKAPRKGARKDGADA